MQITPFNHYKQIQPEERITLDVRNQLVERSFEMMVTTPEEAQANYKTEFEVITRRIKELDIEQQ